MRKISVPCLLLALVTVMQLRLAGLLPQSTLPNLFVPLMLVLTLHGPPVSARLAALLGGWLHGLVAGFGMATCGLVYLLWSFALGRLRRAVWVEKLLPQTLLVGGLAFLLETSVGTLLVLSSGGTPTIEWQALTKIAAWTGAATVVLARPLGMVARSLDRLERSWF